MKAGAQVFEQARVESVQRDSRNGELGWKLATSRGSLWAQEVFVGTSGYTGRATPALQKKLIPIGSFIVTTEVLPGETGAGTQPCNRMIYDSKNFCTTTASRRIGACCLAVEPRSFRRALRR